MQSIIKKQRVTVKQVRQMVLENNAAGTISAEVYNDTHIIHFSNGAKLTFSNPIEFDRVWLILEHKLGFPCIRDFKNAADCWESFINKLDINPTLNVY